MRPFYVFLTFVAFGCVPAFAQSGGVLKAGVLWKDFERDGKSILSQSAVGFTVGIEVRLAAEERTYFKPAAYASRIQAVSQSHFAETQFLKVTDGYDVLTAVMGLETRLIDAGPFHWRAGIGGVIDYIANVRGAVAFEDLTEIVFGVQLSSGFDLGIFAVDINVQRGFNDLLPNDSDSHPVLVSLTAGLFF
ncbi:MAG: hypothetical protein KTR24_14760 [Saprospiraceae bacterium]|nr:hypothetical protein [Saprospiraceae bacterium]